jgi:type II secretory pathway pseudopilin PulG
MAALLGKQGTMADALPRSFAAYRRARQQRRQERQQRQAERQQRQQEAGGGCPPAGDSDSEPENDAAAEMRWPLLVVCPTSVIDNWVSEEWLSCTWPVKSEE